MKIQPANFNGVIGREPSYQAQAPDNSLITAEMSQAVNQLFKDLCSAFPAWRNAMPTRDMYAQTRRLWLETLFEEGISVSQLQHGLAMAKKSEKDFLPSVGQFVAWCKADNYSVQGLPELDVLLNRIKHFQSFGMECVDKFKFHSKAEYWLVTDLYCRCKSYAWSEMELNKQAKATLQAMAERLAKGEALPEPSKQLEKKPAPPISTERKEEYLAQMRAMLRGARNHSGVSA